MCMQIVHWCYRLYVRLVLTLPVLYKRAYSMILIKLHSPHYLALTMILLEYASILSEFIFL
jgi:hypothetical protein